MINMNLSALVAALDDESRTALEGAAEMCVNRGGHEIGIEDFFEKVAATKTFLDICQQFEINVDALRQSLEKSRKVAGLAQGRPVFSTILVEFLQEAYLFSTLEMGERQVGIGVLIVTILSNPVRYGIMPFYKELDGISVEKLRTLLAGLNEQNNPGQGQPGDGKIRGGGEGALNKYATDFTEEARQGKIDPVFARGDEIRQVIDILTRRRKNNPILVGDPGVGKTAVAEGLALKISQGDVPETLLNVRLIGLDMGRLQAGASVKGEFEKRLKNVIDEVKSSPVPIILFIDEAHTLVGSGNAAGASDGANLLKPALARGELRTLAATTWSEYKKYFEKDAALARRFQLVKLDEPSPEQTVVILRGLIPNYEKSHAVYVRDEAVVHMAELSARYISGRYLPDKAIDVLDTACARVKVSLGAKPAQLEILESDLWAAQTELSARERDITVGISCNGSEGNLAALRAKISSMQEQINVLMVRWQKEKDLVTAIIELRAQGHELEKIKELQAQLKEAQGNHPLVFYEVDAPLVTELISEWTGVPVEKLNAQGEALHHFGQKMRKRIKGQEGAIAAIEKTALTVFSGLENPNTPNGIFLLVGPSGVGKTETALAVAEELFGGERFLISVNMSEFQEKHTVSRLIGSPPGYVGYGEGGRLTEAVRRQPYSAVLFDEVEKSHPDILNLFYQMFDKGVLADGEGREIDFKNTMIFMTSNLGSEIIDALCEDGEIPDYSVMIEALRPALSQFFKPALLGRLTIVPYLPMPPEVMSELVEVKLGLLAQRFTERRNLKLSWDEAIIKSIAASCTAVESGARNIDHVINANLLPGLSNYLLGRQLNVGAKVHLGLNTENGLFTYSDLS